MILFLGSDVRSIQFTGISTLAFADVPSGEMVTPCLFSTATQLAVGLGVTLGAIGGLAKFDSTSFLSANIPGASFQPGDS